METAAGAGATAAVVAAAVTDIRTSDDSSLSVSMHPTSNVPQVVEKVHCSLLLPRRETAAGAGPGASAAASTEVRTSDSSLPDPMHGSSGA